MIGVADVDSLLPNDQFGGSVALVKDLDYDGIDEVEQQSQSHVASLYHYVAFYLLYFAGPLLRPFFAFRLVCRLDLRR